MVLVVKGPPANSGDIRGMDSIPGLGRSPGGGHGNPLQSSCLENPKDRGAWWATARGVIKSQIWLKLLSTSVWQCTSFTKTAIFFSRGTRISAITLYKTGRTNLTLKDVVLYSLRDCFTVSLLGAIDLHEKAGSPFLNRLPGRSRQTSSLNLIECNDLCLRIPNFIFTFVCLHIFYNLKLFLLYHAGFC